MRKLLAAACAASLCALTIFTPVQAQQNSGAVPSQNPVSYFLLQNTFTTGPKYIVAGGSYVLPMSGTFNGASLTFTKTLNGVTTTFGPYASIPTTVPCLQIEAGATVQMTVTGGSPSGLNATLGGVGPGGCPTGGGGSGGGGAATIANGADVTQGAIGDTQATGTVVGFLRSLWTAFFGSPTAIKVDGSAVTQPISASALPLPSGAATAANQTSVHSAPGTAQTQAVTIQGNASGIAVPMSAASLPLPTGAATAANQTTGNASLATIASNSGASLPAGSALIGNTGGPETAAAAATGGGVRMMGKDGSGNAQDLSTGTTGILDSPRAGTLNRVVTKTSLAANTNTTICPAQTNAVAEEIFFTTAGVGISLSGGTLTTATRRHHRRHRAGPVLCDCRDALHIPRRSYQCHHGVWRRGYAPITLEVSDSAQFSADLSFCRAAGMAYTPRASSADIAEATFEGGAGSISYAPLNPLIPLLGAAGGGAQAASAATGFDFTGQTKKNVARHCLIDKLANDHAAIIARPEN